MIAVGPPFAGFIQFGRYASGEIGITIFETESFSGPPLIKASVSLADYSAPRADPASQVWIKTWAENKGVVQCLEASGVLRFGGTFFACGGHENAVACLCDLTEAAIAELNRQEHGI